MLQDDPFATGNGTSAKDEPGSSRRNFLKATAATGITCSLGGRVAHSRGDQADREEAHCQRELPPTLESSSLEGYTEFPEPFENDGIRYRVFHRGRGPGVIVMHEILGLAPSCVSLGDCLAREGFTVFLPMFFGEPGKASRALTGARDIARICISREFHCLARNESSPVTIWLRALSREVHHQCGGPGVGAIGMCLTGGFVLSMMIDEWLIAPVACQPALPFVSPVKLPFGIDAAQRSALGVSDEDLANAKRRHEAGAPLLGLRYDKDTICPRERMDRLKKEFPKMVRMEIASDEKKHSTLTEDFSPEAYRELVDFLRRNLRL